MYIVAVSVLLSLGKNTFSLFIFSLHYIFAGYAVLSILERRKEFAILLISYLGGGSRKHSHGFINFCTLLEIMTVLSKIMFVTQNVVHSIA